MRSCLVGGAGRSGTSLMAGLFRNAGYFYGSDLWHGTNSNPEGFFEDVEINAINEDLLDRIVPWRPRGIKGAVLPFLRHRTQWGQRWLEVLPVEQSIPADKRIVDRISAQTMRRPFLFKDPLFSYTLPVWQPYLPEDTVLLCVFREPERTVNSILKICRDERYLRTLQMSRERAEAYWLSVYTHILENDQVSQAPWIFVHYDEILSRRALPFLSETLGAPIDYTMLRPELKRSSANGHRSAELQRVYDELCARAEMKYLSAA